MDKVVELRTSEELSDWIKLAREAEKLTPHYMAKEYLDSVSNMSENELVSEAIRIQLELDSMKDADGVREKFEIELHGLEDILWRRLGTGKVISQGIRYGQRELGADLVDYCFSAYHHQPSCNLRVRREKEHALSILEGIDNLNSDLRERKGQKMLYVVEGIGFQGKPSVHYIERGVVQGELKFAKWQLGDSMHRKIIIPAKNVSFFNRGSWLERDNGVEIHNDFIMKELELEGRAVRQLDYLDGRQFSVKGAMMFGGSYSHNQYSLIFGDRLVEDTLRRKI